MARGGGSTPTGDGRDQKRKRKGQDVDGGPSSSVRNLDICTRPSARPGRSCNQEAASWATGGARQPGPRMNGVRESNSSLFFLERKLIHSERKVSANTDSKFKPDTTFEPDDDCRFPTHHDSVEAKRGFIQEANAYNRLVSYRRCDHGRAVSELSEAMRLEWSNRYFIAKKMEPTLASQTLQNILETNVDTIEEGKGYTFSFPNCDKAYVEYDPNSRTCLLLAGHMKRRSFCHENQMLTATRTAWMVPQVMDSIDSGFEMAKRSAFYMNKPLYGDQVNSDRVINDLCCLTGCRQSSLNLFPAQRGIVLGNIAIRFKGGEHPVSCSIGTLIPKHIEQIESIGVLENSPDIEYILVVEKLTMMSYLEQMKYHNNERCIILTGCGMPSILTRQFLKLLKDCTGLPVYGLCDPDPEGAEIMLVYSRGSVNTAYDNFNVSVPSLIWVGFSTSDLDDFELELPDFSFSDLNRSDKATLASIHRDSLSDEWKRRIEHMEQLNKKLVFEEVLRFGLPYFAQILLPKMIERARRNRDIPARGNRDIPTKAVSRKKHVFYGIKVKPGHSARVSIEEGHLLCLTLAVLGDSRKSDKAIMFVQVGNGEKLTIGTLSTDRCPQINFDLRFERNFELSHSSLTATVSFLGYRVFQLAEDVNDDDDDDTGSSDYANGEEV